MALGTWDERRHGNQGQGTQKTLIHVLPFPLLPFPSSQEVIFPGVVVRLPILTNDAPAALFQVDQSPLKVLGKAENWLAQDDYSHPTDESNKDQDS